MVGSTRRLGTPECSCQLVACSYPGEHPLVPDWLGASTTDPARIEAWWCQHPRANIGLLTGVVFDVLDVPSELVEDQAVLAILPEGPVARTGTGRHHYFVAPSGSGQRGHAGPFRQRPPARLLARPQRLRARRPSRHVGGGATQWLRPLGTVPDAPPHAFAAMAGAWVQSLQRLCPRYCLLNNCRTFSAPPASQEEAQKASKQSRPSCCLLALPNGAPHRWLSPRGLVPCAAAATSTPYD